MGKGGEGKMGNSVELVSDGMGEREERWRRRNVVVKVVEDRSGVG